MNFKLSLLLFNILLLFTNILCYVSFMEDNKVLGFLFYCVNCFLIGWNIGYFYAVTKKRN